MLYFILVYFWKADGLKKSLLQKKNIHGHFVCIICRLDMCRRTYPNESCNRGTAGKTMSTQNKQFNKERPIKY